MQPDLIISRFGELWLKGANRWQFINRLTKNLASALKGAGLTGGRLEVHDARFVYALPNPESLARAVAIFRDTPGLSNVSAAVRVEQVDMESLGAAAVELVQSAWKGQNGRFACRARRIDKHFPMRGPDIERTIGDRVGHAVPHMSVDLRAPTHTILVEILHDVACVSAEHWDGAGGLPIGTAGKVMLLLSGGLDSPVAGYLAQKRGCELEAVYFHSPPFIGDAAREKVITLARVLAARQGGMPLHICHFTAIQEAIHTTCDPKLTVILYRRFMYRIAARLAEQRKALALCTGENLGQVASQTLENLSVVDGHTGLLTLRPLLAHDKHETTTLARRIGTYETSILPAEDCCSLFVPRHPAVRAPLSVVEAQEKKLDVEALTAAALAQTEKLWL